MKSITLSAFDLGTYSIKGLCCKKDFNTQDIDILGQVEVACSGMRNGEVVRPERVAVSLAAAKEELSKKSGFKIKEAMASINGTHLFTVASQGLVSVSRADQKISYEDERRVLKAAEAIHLPNNKEIVTVLPLEYMIDNEGPVNNPIGLAGTRLEVKAMVIGVFTPTSANLEKALKQAGIAIFENGTIPAPLAAARAVLSSEHRDLGCLVIDLGAACTSVSVFEKGDLRDFAILPIGSANITNDIAICLRTEIATAEAIKKKYGTLKALSKNQLLPKKFLAFKKKTAVKLAAEEAQDEAEQGQELWPDFSPKLLKDIVEDRFNQLFAEIQKALKKINNAEALPGGVFLTGGGSAIPGLVDLAKQKLKLPCRLGIPRGVIGCDDPKFAACLGLLLTAFDNLEEGQDNSGGEGIKEKIKRLFKMFLP